MITVSPAGVSVIHLRSNLLMENKLWEVEQICHLTLGNMSCAVTSLKLVLVISYAAGIGPSFPTSRT